MKKYIMAFLLVACAALPAYAASGLLLSKSTINFGVMTEGPVAQEQVTITNTTSAPITIDNVTTS